MKQTGRNGIRDLLTQTWDNLPYYGAGFLFCWMILRRWSPPAELVGVGGYAASLLLYRLIDTLVRPNG